MRRGVLTVVGDIVDDNNAVCSPVVRRGDSAESFLPWKQKASTTNNEDRSAKYLRYPTV